MAHDLDKYYNTCMQLVEKASEVINKAFLKVKRVETKSCETDLVTETDKEVEVLLIDGLKKAFPDHKFIGEESVSGGEKCVLGDEPTWVIDPVDGTMNFVHSLPLIAISIGLLIEKKPVIGIICNPILKLMYTARAGQGAFLNGDKIRVSGETNISKALICTECGTSNDPEKRRVVLKNLATVLDRCHGVRCIGSCCCAMAFVASGGADAFCHMGQHIWDVAAGQLIIEEAGGFLCDYGGCYKGKIFGKFTRSLGSAAMNMANVASGGLDAYYEYGLHAWDMAAGDLIIREAGGVVYDATGGPFDVLNRRVVCASSEALAKEIAGLLEHIELERD